MNGNWCVSLDIASLLALRSIQPVGMVDKVYSVSKSRYDGIRNVLR